MDDQIQNVGEEQVVSEKINIGGTEYDPAEAQQLIGLGSKARDYEKQWNSPIDSLASAYGKSQTELQGLRAKAQEYETQIQTFQQKQQAGTDNQGDLERAREAARKLGIPLNEDIDKRGYLTKDDVQKQVQEALQAQKEVDKLLSTADKLEGELNGADGRPKFRKQIVLYHAQATNQPDLQKAYDDLYKDELTEWSKTQVTAGKRPALKTIQSTTSNKQFKESKPNDGNFKDMLGQALRGEI